ncbi:MAG TPA: TolC family protein [Longimicrobiales bacterium]
MRRLLVAALLSCVAGGPAAAQDVPPVLTLEDALRIARQRNPSHLRVRNDADVTAVAERAAWSQFLPSVSASFGTGLTTSRTITGENDFGQAVELPEPIDYRRTSASQSIGASLTLFDAMRRVNEVRAARAESRAVAARIAGSEQELVAEVSRRYYAALQARRRIALEERLLASARERLEITEQQLRVARTHPEDVLGAQLDVARQELALDQARGAARKADLDLGQVMGLEEDIAFELADDLPPVFDPALLDEEALVARALETAPRLVELAASAAAAEHHAASARSARWPTLSVSASFSRGMSLSSNDALFELNPRNRSFSVQLGAQIPLFDRFQVSRQIAQANATADDAREALREERLRVERDVRAALVDLRNAYRSLQLAERSAELARQRVELGQEKFRLGAISFTDLQRFIDDVAREERAAVDARFALINALIAVERHVGGTVRP